MTPIISQCRDVTPIISVLQLGNPEQNCKPDIILKNERVIGTGFDVQLKHIDKKIKPFREMRNLHVHRGRKPQLSKILKSDILDNIRVIQIFNSISPEEASKNMSPKMMDFLVKGEAKSLVAVMELDIDDLCERICRLFDNLKVAYDTLSSIEEG